jgi:hypothetical protein
MGILNPIAGRRLVWLWLVLLATVSGGGMNLSAQTTREYEVKAAFLFNFAQFIDWPTGAFTNTDTPFVIGILGNDPFGAALEATVQGETINNRKIIIKRAATVADLADCQLIFVSKSEKGHVTEILSALDSRPVLKVSELEGFAQQGGNINFYLEGGKVRFEVNPAAAERDGLKVSSQLLNLGKIIRTGKEGR